ncbi:MAG: O-antigen ligase family protein [Leclercia sp.]
MPALRHIDPSKLYTQRGSITLEIAAYILCFATLITAPINDNVSMKLFSITAGLGFFSLVLRGKPENYHIKHWALPLSLLFIGIINLIWYSLFKESHSPFRSTYHNYLNTAKIMILGAPLVLLALNSKLKPKSEILLYILYSLSFIIAAYAHYIKATMGLTRIDFGIGTATGAAYSIMLVGIVSAVSILYSKKNHPILFIFNVIAVFYALALTQTRSSMLIFPVISILTLVTCYLKSPKKLFYSVIGFLTLLITLLVVFSKPVYERYHESISDLNQYSNNNSVNSVGARLAMFEIGFDIFSQAPFKLRSADERAYMMNDIVKQKNYLSGSLEFTNVHLHNEIIESASLKGIAGILSTLLFYIALVYTVYHHRSLGLFALTLAIIGTGLSDVLIWSRSIPIIIVTTITLLLFIKKHKAT